MARPPAGVAALRYRLQVTQERFASLLGVSIVSVNRWENGAARPTHLSAVLLSLLTGALLRHDAPMVARSLRACADSLARVRLLARLCGDADVLAI